MGWFYLGYLKLKVFSFTLKENTRPIRAGKFFANSKQINGDNPLTGAITNGTGAWLGCCIGNYVVKSAVNTAGKWITNGWDSKFSPIMQKYSEVKGDYGISKEVTPSNIPGSFGDISGSFSSEYGGKNLNQSLRTN